MTNNLTIDTVVAHIAANEDMSNGMSKEAKELTKGNAGRKVDSYVRLMHAVATWGMADWNRKVSAEFRAALKAKGVSEACVKRYVENTTKALKASTDLFEAAQAGPFTLASYLEAKEINTEGKIVEIFQPKCERWEALAKEAAGLDKDDYPRFAAMVKALKDKQVKVAHAAADAEARKNAMAGAKIDGAGNVVIKEEAAA